MQDWDAILWYTFEPKEDPAWKPYIGDPFDISLDPVKMPELAAGALLFLRGDVGQAKQTVDRAYTAQQVYDSMLLPGTERPYFTPRFPLELALEDEMRILSFDGPATKTFAQGVAPNPIRSDTGQLTWRHSGPDTGLVTVDSPRTQALIGFVRAAADSNADSNLGAQIENTFCAIQLSSLDGQPISRSAKLLLVAGGRVENTGQRWNSAGTDVTNWGESPTLIDPVRGMLVLKHLEAARAVQLQAIDGVGQPLGTPVAATRMGNAWQIPLGGSITTWYELTISR
ncbi:MAG: hypothetical protein ABSD59_02900 [Terracidiphilus sp.]|jgi:hypothetical protein